MWANKFITIFNNYLRRKNKINFSVDIDKYNKRNNFYSHSITVYVIITLSYYYYYLTYIIIWLKWIKKNGLKWISRDLNLNQDSYLIT